MPSRGEVWLANLKPGGGPEPGKTRPDHDLMRRVGEAVREVLDLIDE